MTAPPTVDEVREKLIPVLRRHGVQHADLFGSIARGDAVAESDIDLIVDIPPEKSLLDLVALKIDLEEALQRRVDVVERSAVHPLLRDRITVEQVAVL